MTRNDVPTVVYEEPAAREARISRDSDGVPSAHTHSTH